MKTTGSAGRTPSFASLEQRVANQTRRINQGERSGTLTKDEASGLRSRLTDAQKQIESDRFDGNGSQGLAAQQKLLNGLSKDIRSQKGNETIDADKRMSNIEKRIANGEKDGSLTAEEASGLKEKATALKEKLAAATTPEAKQALAGELAELSKSVRTEPHDTEMDPARRVENFKARMEKGVADGSLTADEAKQLQTKLDAAGNDPAKLNELHKDIFRSRHNQNVDQGAMSQSLGSQIDGLAGKGASSDVLQGMKDALAKLGEAGSGEAIGARMNILREQIRSIAI